MPTGKTSIEVTHPPVMVEGVPLREYVDVRLAALQAQMEVKLGSIDRATVVALSEIDRRLEGMNEFRGALKDTTGRLATRAELELLAGRFVESLERVRSDVVEIKSTIPQLTRRDDFIVSCERNQAELAEIKHMHIEKTISRTEYSAGMALVADDIDSLNLSRATLAGKAEQSSVNVALLLSVVSLLMGLVGLAVSLLNLLGG